MRNKEADKFPFNLFKSVGRLVGQLSRRKYKTVYFISGMCYNCKVFDKIVLPKGFLKQYIEWLPPQPDESLSDYTRRMTCQIDTSRPFILVGYSFGAVIMQEMNRFLQPEKNIIISSFKDKDEIPVLFKAVKMANLVERMPDKIYTSTDFITNAFNYFFFHASNSEFTNFMTITDATYIKWAVKQITDWKPDNKHEHLYHIHGTEDQIFPYDRLKNVIPIEGGDHLMVFKKADIVNPILSSILLIKE